MGGVDCCMAEVGGVNYSVGIVNYSERSKLVQV